MNRMASYSFYCVLLQPWNSFFKDGTLNTLCAVLVTLTTSYAFADSQLPVGGLIILPALGDFHGGMRATSKVTSVVLFLPRFLRTLDSEYERTHFSSLLRLICWFTVRGIR